MHSKKLLHLHLSDSMGNLKTLICRVSPDGIYYSMYGGTGSRGVGFSTSNIQYYDIIDGQMKWDRNRHLPVENLEGETEQQFKDRVINQLNNSTDKVVRVVEPIKFA